MKNEQIDKIRLSYSKRGEEVNRLYDPLRAGNVRMNLERMLVQASLIRDWLGGDGLANKNILEVGCGTGTNILNLIALGASSERIVGNELLEARIAAAAMRLPSSVRLNLGDASRFPSEFGQFDLILQFVVFSSILDDTLLASLSRRMWDILTPGGAILSYDFVINNPSNPDVRGISVQKLMGLFPNGNFKVKSLTVAPPLSRWAFDGLYPILSRLPFLRTHRFCLIRKPKM